MPPVPAKTYARIFAYVYQQTLVEEYKKALGVMRPHVEAIFQKACSGSYPLRPAFFLNEQEVRDCLALALKKPDLNVIFVSHRDKSSRPEKNIDLSFWLAIEHTYGRDPWGSPRYAEFLQKTSWTEVAQSIDKTMKNNFGNELNKILSDNIQVTLFYFLSFFVNYHMESIKRVLPIIKKFPECIPLGRSQYASNTWYVMTE